MSISILSKKPSASKSLLNFRSSYQGRLRPWKIRSTREIFSVRPWIRVWEDQLDLPDGRRVESFYRLQLPAFVTVIAKTVKGKLIMERQYKHGVGRVSFTFPSGAIEKGESALIAAKRELLEETGYGARRWKRLGSFVTDGNRGGALGHMFLAQGCYRQTLPGHQDLETMQIIEIDPGKIFSMISKGEIATMATLAGVLLAAQYR